MKLILLGGNMNCLDDCKCECCEYKYTVVKRIWLDNDVKLEPGTVIPNDIIEKVKDTVHFNIWLNEGRICTSRPYLENCRNSALEVLENDAKYSDINSEENEILKAFKDYYDSVNKHCCSDHPDMILEVPEDSEIYLLSKYRNKNGQRKC